MKVLNAVFVAVLLLAVDRAAVQPHGGTITVANAPLR